MGPVELKLNESIHQGRALFFVLLDPDSQGCEGTIAAAIAAASAGADALLLGGSLMMSPAFSLAAKEIKKHVSIPVILFPGGASQVVAGPDALLFTTLVSGRNPQYLIDEQVRGAVIAKALKLEPLPTAYMLIESGKTTAVEYISNTKPIPADKPSIAAAHALAAEMMGMRWVYLEAGSGAQNPVPLAMVKAVRSYCNLNVIVGGGIRTPEEAAARVKAGAHAIVMGNQFEDKNCSSLMAEVAKAIHA